EILRRVLQLIRIVGVDREHRVAVGGMPHQGVGEPPREFGERVARRQLEARRQQRFVAPERFDEPRAGAVGGRGDGAHEPRRFERDAAVADRSNDEQPLARLQMEADTHRQIGVGPQHRVEVGRHARRIVRERSRVAHDRATESAATMHGALLLRLTLFAAGAAIALVALVRYIEPRLTFFPVAGETATPAQSGVPCESETIVTADGERLRAWTMARADACATILYFHGNGGNLSIWAPILAGVQRHGYAVHALHYRGYGGSTGRPSERGLYRDVDAALEWFHAAYGSRKCPSVYWGRSMGTTMAAYAAARRRPDGLILESGFPDARSLLRGFLP